MPEGITALDPDALCAELARGGALKVFPLAGVVSLPGTPTPLHVFEPRYRALVADALRGDRLMAIALLEDPERAADSRPPLRPIAGACVLDEETLLPDGRYDLVAQGVARVRLLEELERGRPYREFRVEVLEDRMPEEGPASLVRSIEALEQCVYDLAAVLPPESGAPQLAEAAARLSSDPGRLADLVAAAVLSEPEARIAVLEEIDVARRLELVTQEAASVLLMLGQGRGQA